RQPAISDARNTSQEHIRSSTQPYRDRAADRERIESRLSDGMELTFVADDLLTPQQAHHLYLLLDHAPSCMEIHAQCLVLHRIPAHSHTQAQLPVSEYIHL